LAEYWIGASRVEQGPFWNYLFNFRSIAFQIIPAVSVPLNLSTATIPVGEVTLISVSQRPLQFRSKRCTDLLFGVRQLRRLGCPAGGKVRANFALAWPAIDRASELAIDENDALVPINYLGNECLEDMGFTVGSVEQFHQRCEICAVTTDPEH
jgi:hypothetical protein